MEVETIHFVIATVVLLLLTTVLTMPKGAGGTSSLAEPGLDVIGDVHGQAGKLERLLARMGYRERAGGWSHPTRRAVFVGDLVDGQGERQVDTVRIARAMVDSGAALIVAGNHEFNAVAWHLGEREHSDKNRRQHERFLTEVEEGSALHVELVGWFKGLPLWLEVSPGEYGVASERGLRVVHACWDPRAQRTLRDSFGEVPRMSEALVTAASVDGSDAWEAVEHLLKGPELPVDPPYLDKGGHERDQAWISDPNCHLAEQRIVGSTTEPRLRRSSAEVRRDRAWSPRLTHPPVEDATEHGGSERVPRVPRTIAGRPFSWNDDAAVRRAGPPRGQQRPDW
ncbi:metallophosphoesterase [Planctomycetota bacterium]|nr:metallophosphoesterase [Planctomycetota bacterium]